MPLFYTHPTLPQYIVWEGRGEGDIEKGGGIFFYILDLYTDMYNSCDFTQHNDTGYKWTALLRCGSVNQVLYASTAYDTLIYLVFYPEEIVSQQCHCLIEMYVKTWFYGEHSHTRINVGLQYLTWSTCLRTNIRVNDIFQWFHAIVVVFYNRLINKSFLSFSFKTT